jgi:hypothetical protein
MDAAAKSVCYFGFYLYGVALTLIFFPNVLLRVLGIPETSEVWIHIVGLLAVFVVVDLLGAAWTWRALRVGKADRSGR